MRPRSHARKLRPHTITVYVPLILQYGILLYLDASGAVKTHLIMILIWTSAQPAPLTILMMQILMIAFTRTVNLAKYITKWAKGVRLKVGLLVSNFQAQTVRLIGLTGTKVRSLAVDVQSALLFTTSARSNANHAHQTQPMTRLEACAQSSVRVICSLIL